MALIADSGAIYALYDARDRYHSAVARVINEESGVIVIPMAILAEIDYLLRVRLGSRALFRFLEDITVGGFTFGAIHFAGSGYLSRAAEKLRRSRSRPGRRSGDCRGRAPGRSTRYSLLTKGTFAWFALLMAKHSLCFPPTPE